MVHNLKMLLELQEEVLYWSANCVIGKAEKATNFVITNTKSYVPVVDLSTQDSTKLLQQLKTGYKRTINCNDVTEMCQSNHKNQYLD